MIWKTNVQQGQLDSLDSRPLVKSDDVLRKPWVSPSVFHPNLHPIFGETSPLEPAPRLRLNAQHDQLPKDAAIGEAPDEVEIPTTGSGYVDLGDLG